MELVEHSFYYDWEMALMQWLQAHLGAWGTALASFFSIFGEELMCVAVLGLLYWCVDKKLGRGVGLAVFAGMTINPMIKNIVLRPRPYCVDPSIKCLRPVNADADIYDLAAQGYSFPSGHATDTVTMFSSLAMRGKKGWLTLVGIAIPLLCGISRMCLGVHYPTDVLCGWLLGAVVMVTVSLLDSRIKDERILYALLLAAGAPGWFYCRSDDYFTCFGILAGFILGLRFEKRYVGFENTRSVVRGALRLIGGVVIFFGLNTLLKLPFDSAFLRSGTVLAHTVRSARYGAVVFADIGIYPLAFRLGDRIEDKIKRGRRS